MTRFIVGGAGCGKTYALVLRARDAARAGTIVLTAPSESSLAVLRERARPDELPVMALHDIAQTLLPDVLIVDDARAFALFQECARPLFSLEWAEIIDGTLDPEVAAMRMPQRFLEAAFRLICKLRDAQIAPEEFLDRALHGAAAFYANPPNLAHPELLHYTKGEHRDSLLADAAELRRQHRREIDLAKILSRLFRSYLDHPVLRGCLTARDALAQATAALAAGSLDSGSWRQTHVFVDDADGLTLGQMRFLQALCGEALEGVTLAGDPLSKLRAFEGARPDVVFAAGREQLVLAQQRRVPAVVERACRRLLCESEDGLAATGGEVLLFRAATQRAEAQFIAENVAQRIAQGSPPREIALILRSIEACAIYRDALLAKNVPVQVCGDLNLFTEPEALDALAILWTLADPFRHDYLLRVLSGPAVNLSDASLRILCTAPGDPQRDLFAAPQHDSEASARRDEERRTRLGWNVIRGDRDADLPDLALERVKALRAKREQWLEAAKSLALPQLVDRVWGEGLARRGGSGTVGSRYQQQTLARVFARVQEYRGRVPDGTLSGFLEQAQTLMESAFHPGETEGGENAVNLLSLESAYGREFDHVVIANARAGSFPRWYVPDAFLFSPALGMIAKENTGDASAARTAKFTYYMHKTKAREAYNRQERFAFAYAMRRARGTLLVTASGRPSRGVAAPEFLAELQAARIPGATDLSDRWRPEPSTPLGHPSTSSG